MYMGIEPMQVALIYNTGFGFPALFRCAVQLCFLHGLGKAAFFLPLEDIIADESKWWSFESLYYVLNPCVASKDTVKRSLALWDFSFERYKLGLDRGCVCMAFNASREGMWAKKGYTAAGNLYWEMPGIKLCMFLRSDHDQSVGGEWCHCSVAGQENSWPFHSFWGNKSWLMVDNHFCLPVELQWNITILCLPSLALLLQTRMLSLCG